MALSREQFQQLRDKGLSVEQIVKFESGEKPSTSTVFPAGQSLSDRIWSGMAKAEKVVGTVFPGRQIGAAIGTQVARATVPEEQKEFVAPGPTPVQIAGDVADVGLTIAGFKGFGTVGKFASRLLKSIGLGAGLGASRAVAEGGEPKDVAKSAIGGGVVGGALPIAGAALRAVGTQIEQLPERFVNSALRRSKAQVLQDIAKDKVDDFAKYVVENKPVGSAVKLLNDSRNSIESLETKVASAIASATRQLGGKVTVGKNLVLDQVTKLPEAQGALLKRNDVVGIIERLAPQAKRLLQKESLTLEEANHLRRLIDRTLGDKGFLSSQLSLDKEILRSFAHTLRETVKNKAPEGTRALFQEYANEIRFRDGLLERIAQRQGNQVLSFGDFIGGGLGGIFGGGIPGAVLGVAARRAIESVPFKMSAAKVTNALTKVAPVIESMTPAQRTAILNLFADLFSPSDENSVEEAEPQE